MFLYFWIIVMIISLLCLPVRGKSVSITVIVPEHDFFLIFIQNNLGFLSWMHFCPTLLSLKNRIFNVFFPSKKLNDFEIRFCFYFMFAYAFKNWNHILCKSKSNFDFFCDLKNVVSAVRIRIWNLNFSNKFNSMKILKNNF